MMMAAGTGGHVFPALAVAKKLQQEGCQVSWLATPTGMENRLLKQHDIPIYQIDIQGVRGNGLVRKLAAPFKIMKATLSAMRYMKQLKVDAVAGFGGYVAGPGGLAAKILGIPVIIHEQNAVAGFTNTQLARVSTIVCQAFPDTFPANDKIVTTGNPVRKEIAEILNPSWRYQEREKAGEPIHVLIVGGSLGAQALNERIPEALKQLNIPMQVFHQSGQNHAETTRARYENAPTSLTVEVSSYFSFTNSSTEVAEVSDTITANLSATETNSSFAATKSVSQFNSTIPATLPFSEI